MYKFIIPIILIILVLLVLAKNIVIVQQSRAYVVERLGAFQAVWGVGIHLKIPFIERVARKVSLKEQIADFPPQPVITKDNVTIQVDTVLFFQITDPKLYAYGVEHPMAAIENLTATTLRNLIGDLELDQSLTSRDIINAINEKRQITFRYFDYNICGRKVLRHNGAIYQMSPYALLCSDENYYLTAYDGKAQEIKHFRVDKMLDIQVTELSRDGEEIYESFDLGRYASIHFGMFKGEEREVLLRCKNCFSHVIIDRFGEAVHITPEDDSHFTALVQVAVSPQFYGWIFGLGHGVTILGPVDVARGMKEQLEQIQLNYLTI